MATCLLLQLFFISLVSQTITKTNVAHAHTQCLEHEKTLLLELKHQLVFNSSLSPKLVQWNQTDDCCSWKGVECDGAGHVISLKLDDEDISGGLNDSSSLFSLEYLEKLDLSNNDLEESQILRGIHKLTYLTALSLRDCSLKGYFPEMIFQIPTLQYLDLSVNPLLSGTIPQFPHATSLRTVVLSITNFSGSLPDSITNLKNLSVIILSGCQFSGLIPSTLGNLTELVLLDFSDNFFTGSISSSHFYALSNLVEMDLRNNSLTGTIPSSIFALPSLMYIYLQNNQFSGQLHEFPIVNISNLIDLDLSRNRLEGPIPHSFFQLQSLQKLVLFDNLFNNIFQFETLLSPPNLPHHHLSDNKLPQLDATAIPSSSHNFPDFVRQSTLEYLDLSNNQIAGEIPSWIWEIGNQTLSYLNLSHNMFVDLQKPYNIPTFFNLCITILDLHSNQLHGELPLLPLQQAIYVDYSNNYFDNSNIDLNIENFFALNLVFLSLANNALSGSFPSVICNYTILQLLDLSANSFSGSIPPCLFDNLKYLQVLNLGRNNISGRIPNKFVPSCSLETLDLSNNNLVGDVPLSLANCDSLAVMNVGFNHIDDVFPCMLPSSLHVLVLRSNRFHGEIRCNKSWPKLQIIDIASNNLSGYLNPFNFSGWRGMMQDSDANLTRTILGVENTGGWAGFTAQPLFPVNNALGGFDSYYRDEVTLTIKGVELKLVKIWPEFTSIDFSCNNFHGVIPDSIGELKSLYLLNLSHNSLIGAIPKSFGKLKQLGSLDLSVNHLTGEIPQELAGLTFLQIMNVSHNKLVGNIPVGSQIQSFSPDSFEGNAGLCGLPLNISCKNTDASPPKLGNVQLDGETEIEWDYVFASLGYVVGLGSIVWVLLCCRSFREKYFKKIEDIFEKVFYSHQQRKRKRRHGARRVVRNEVSRQ